MAVLHFDHCGDWERICDNELRLCRIGDVVIIACVDKGSRELKETITGELIGYKIERSDETTELKNGVAEIIVDLCEREGGRAVLTDEEIDAEGVDWYIKIIG